MIQTEQTILIDAPIDSVWAYASDMRKWANLMPGMREFTVIDEDDSRWTLKVGVGGLVRTVNVLVHVEQWDGPERVNFTCKLEGDPVTGGGSYTASRKGAHETEVTLKVYVEGTGPMAPMWEAMGGPLLPTLAKAFAGELKAEIEKTVGAPAPQGAVVTEKRSLFATVGGWLRMVWRTIFGSKAQRSPR